MGCRASLRPPSQHGIAERGDLWDQLRTRVPDRAHVAGWRVWDEGLAGTLERQPELEHIEGSVDLACARREVRKLDKVHLGLQHHRHSA